MPDLSTVQLRRSIPIAGGVNNQRILLRPTYTKTRITFTGRSSGIVTMMVKSYVLDDDSKTSTVAQLPAGDFENIVNGQIDLATRKTITLNGEFSCIQITDSGTGDFKADIHQTA